MKYTCTRNSEIAISASEAIVKGISDDGGLYVPSSFPILSKDMLSQIAQLDYPAAMARILSLYLDDFSQDELAEYARIACSSFDDDEICPLVKVEDGLYVLELWHGASASHEDVSYSLFQYLLDASKQRLGITDKALLLVPSSGEGMSALENFKDAQNARVAVFYPASGVSETQRRWLDSFQDKTLSAYAVKASYDELRASLFASFKNADFGDELKKSRVLPVLADGANLGIILAKTACYFMSYCNLVQSGEIEVGDKVNFAIPSGDFADAIACYYAYKSGLPVNRIIVATNANNALSDFFNDGEYNLKRDLYRTMSPSMDILFAHNLERLLYELFDRDDEYIAELYAGLKAEGRFSVVLDDTDADIFAVGWADEEDVKQTISTFFDLDDAIFDTHTAVGASVYNDYSCETDDETPTILLSVSSPYKLPQEVLFALGTRERDCYKAFVKLYNLTALECPDNIIELYESDKKKTEAIDKSAIADVILSLARENDEN